MRLFKAHIGTGDGARHFVLDNGGRLLPVNGFQSQGSLDNGIKRLLGLKISKAITEVPMREEELADVIVATRSVTMSVSHNPQDDGVLKSGSSGRLWMNNSYIL